MSARGITKIGGTTRIGLLASCLLLVNACPVPGSDEPDAGNESGLGFVFVIDPEAGDEIGGPFEISIDTVSLRLRDFRAIGDAAPGDTRTTAPNLDLDWAPDVSPDDLLFSEAPLGFYSRLEARVDGYIITGSVTVNTVSQLFEIDDELAWSVTIPLSGVALDAGALLKINMIFHLSGVVMAVPWDMVPEDGGRLRVRDGDPWIDAVRQAVAVALDIDG